jgi:hypothetical protein
VKFVVISKAHNVFKQSSLINLIASVRNLNTPPIGLPGDQTIAFEQMADKCFTDGGFIVLRIQQFWCGLIVPALNVHAV